MATFSDTPTAQSPLLIGLLVDVSASMRTSVYNRSGGSLNLLESVRDALDDLAVFGTQLCEQNPGQTVLPLFRLFAYGFGFGNPLTALTGHSKSPVKDLLDVHGNGDSTITADRLATSWPLYKSYVEGMKFDMLGNTPMLQAFYRVQERFQIECKRQPTCGPPILLIVSDGEPTDGSVTQVAAAAAALREDGVLVVSCYVADEDITEPRRLYSQPRATWPKGTKLMFDCASQIPDPSQFEQYLREFRWNIAPNARLFTQINQSDMVSEFLKVVLSSLRQPPATP